MASGRFLAISLFSLLAFQLHAAADYETALLPPVLVKGEPVRTVPLAERMAELHVPGVSIAYIHNGEIAWTRTYGERWPGLFGQESAKDKWILCRLFSRDADLGRHAGRA